MTKDKQISHYSDGRFAILANGLTIFSAIACVFAPVFVLFLTDMGRLGMVMTALASTVIFAFMITLVANPRPERTFLAIVTCVFGNLIGGNFADFQSYGALLSAFLSSMNQICECS